MNRRSLLFSCFLGLLLTLPALSQTPAKSQAGPRDPEVVRGIRQVDEGDYEGAILTLDAAARRLAQGKSADVNDLSQAYVYLGIAYIAKGHESAAKAKFRAAIEQIRDLSLSPDKYPPKVIDVFEAAKNEGKAGAPGPSAAKKGGASKGLLIAGGVAVVGGGVALAAGGGGSAAPATTPSPSAGSRLDFSGTLPTASGADYMGYVAVATQPGTLEARVSWTNGQIQFRLACQEQNPPYTGCSGNFVQTSNTTGVYQTAVTQKPYLVLVENYSGVRDTFTLTLLFP